MPFTQVKLMLQDPFIPAPIIKHSTTQLCTVQKHKAKLIHKAQESRKALMVKTTAEYRGINDSDGCC